MRVLDGRRAISPVIGVTLLVAIVVVLTAVSAGIFFSLTEEKEPAPNVRMTLEPADDGVFYELVHDDGDVLDGDKVKLLGVTDPDALAGRNLSSRDSQRVLPTETTVEVVWYGEHDTSYLIWEGEVPEQDTVPSSDEGCAWVEAESNGGVDDVKITGDVIDCDVVTEKVIEVQGGGVIIGDTDSVDKEVDADDATFYGDVNVSNNLNIQDGLITGEVVSSDLVKIDSSEVGGPIDAVDTVEIIDGSSVGGDVESENGIGKVLDSEVSGSVVGGDSVKLQGATVAGDVYAPAGEFDCTDSTINGQDCSDYTPLPPGEF